MATTAGTYQYLKDAQGTVTDIADNSGNKIQHYIYSAFGSIIGIQDAMAADVTAAPPLRTSYTYTGREYDSESGYYYYRARYYDSFAGRFLQRDTEPGHNRYAYVNNSPFNKIDPTGKFGIFAKVIAMTVETKSKSK